VVCAGSFNSFAACAEENQAREQLASNLDRLISLLVSAGDRK